MPPFGSLSDSEDPDFPFGDDFDFEPICDLLEPGPEQHRPTSYLDSLLGKVQGPQPHPNSDTACAAYGQPPHYMAPPSPHDVPSSYAPHNVASRYEVPMASTNDGASRYEVPMDQPTILPPMQPFAYGVQQPFGWGQGLPAGAPVQPHHVQAVKMVYDRTCPPPQEDHELPPFSKVYIETAFGLPPSTTFSLPPSTTFSQPPPSTTFSQPPPSTTFSQPQLSAFSQPMPQPPAAQSQLPAAGSQLPAAGSQPPAAQLQPAAGSQQPAVQSQPPAVRLQPAAARTQPAAGSQPPAVQSQQPAVRLQPPAVQLQPAAGSQQPAARTQPPAARTQPPAVRFQPLAVRTQQPAVGFQPLAAAGQPRPAATEGQPRPAVGFQPLAAGAGQPRPAAAGQQPAVGFQPLAATGQPRPAATEGQPRPVFARPPALRTTLRPLLPALPSASPAAGPQKRPASVHWPSAGPQKRAASVHCPAASPQKSPGQAAAASECKALRSKRAAAAVAARAITKTFCDQQDDQPQRPPSPEFTKQERIRFDFLSIHDPDATHAQIRVHHHAAVFESPSAICCHKRKNDESCNDRVRIPISPFVIAFPNGKAFELDGGFMNVLEEFDEYTEEEAERFYNHAHKKSRGKTKAYKQLVVHQSKEKELMPTDPARLLLVHKIFFMCELHRDESVKFFPCSITDDLAETYNWDTHLQSMNSFYLNVLQVILFGSLCYIRHS